MKPHILIVADGRSPTARSWIKNLQALGYDVSLVSTFVCQPPNGLRHFDVIPLAFSSLGRNSNPGTSEDSKEGPTIPVKDWVRRFAPFFQFLRYFFGPLTVYSSRKMYQNLVSEYQPDLVHALRIPFEGMLARYTPIGLPFVVATWGNDLTLHAKGSFLMGRLTRRCLTRANGLTSDTLRDVQLAHKWGLTSAAPTLIVPGSGGLDLDALQASKSFNRDAFEIPENRNWVVNPRGLRPGSVHQDVFFAAIPKVLSQRPKTVFICPGLGGINQAKVWMTNTGFAKNIYLLKNLSQAQLWALFKQAQVFVSPSSHDGTPNSLLEAMACGCFPVVGDIDSLRAWIKHGVNGLLVNPLDPDELATAILSALESPTLRQNAANHNRDIIKNRAAQSATQPKIDDFYTQFLS